ncbi:MAG: hypothetical protein QW253_00160 [Metallosphaera sp.]
MILKKDEILSEVLELSRLFKIPPPRVVFTKKEGRRGPIAWFDESSYTIYLTSEELPLKVIAHEMAHASQAYYGIDSTLKEAEAYASIFENVWEGVKSGNSRIYKCSFCGYPLMYTKCLRCGNENYLRKEMPCGGCIPIKCEVCGTVFSAYGGSVVCPSCGARYSKVLKYPEEITISAEKLLGTSLGVALGTAILSTFLTGEFPTREDPREVKIQKIRTATAIFLSGGFLGLLGGILAAR